MNGAVAASRPCLSVTAWRYGYWRNTRQFDLRRLKLTEKVDEGVAAVCNSATAPILPHRSSAGSERHHAAMECNVWVCGSADAGQYSCCGHFIPSRMVPVQDRQPLPLSAVPALVPAPTVATMAQRDADVADILGARFTALSHCRFTIYVSGSLMPC